MLLTAHKTAMTKIIGRPFRKGKSGNSSGRPKVDVSLVELARTYTEDAPPDCGCDHA